MGFCALEFSCKNSIHEIDSYSLFFTTNFYFYIVSYLITCLSNFYYYYLNENLFIL